MPSPDQLEKIGLSRNEAKVYRTLLQLGSAKAGRIAKRASVERTSTYNALKHLLEKGLVSYVRIGEVRWFQPCSPQRLVEFYETKVEYASQLQPELQKIYTDSMPKQNVRLFRGARGIISVLNDIVSEGKENLIFGSEGRLRETLPHYADRFRQMIRKKKIHMKSLVREDRTTEAIQTAEVRVVPKTVKSPVTTNIYGDKIAIIIWADPAEAVVIENKAAADAYRSYFDFMWEHAKPKTPKPL